MTGKEMWETYINMYPEAEETACEIWCYGSDEADELARLTAAGIKTATASAYPLYELDHCDLPREGEYNVIEDTTGTAVCVTRTLRVSVVPFHAVSAEHAFREGEGDRSLVYWRKVHQDFFTEELKAVGLRFTEDMNVVCEEFEVVFK